MASKSLMGVACKIGKRVSSKSTISRSVSANVDTSSLIIPIPEKKQPQNSSQTKHHSNDESKQQNHPAKFDANALAVDASKMHDANQAVSMKVKGSKKNPILTQLLAKSRDRNIQPAKISSVQMYEENLSIKNLQPARLPRFLNALENNAAVNAKSVTANYPSFSESKTVTACTLPLKPSRLANAFPEPVKLLPSRKVSDKEKADIMFAESRSMGSSSSASNNATSTTTRKYSTFTKTLA